MNFLENSPFIFMMKKIYEDLKLFKIKQILYDKVTMN